MSISKCSEKSLCASEDIPQWSQLMYTPTPNVLEVDRLYLKYYQAHTYKKTKHTTNFTKDGEERLITILRMMEVMILRKNKVFMNL